MNQVKTRLFTAQIGIVTLFSSLISLGLANSAQALSTGISNFTGGNQNSFRNTRVSRGFRFQATEDLNITSLGVYDINGDGLTLSSGKTGVDVGLWNDSGTLLGQVSVLGGTSAPVLNSFRYADLSNSISLTTGSFYRVAADMSDIAGVNYIDSAIPTTLNGIDSITEVRNNDNNGNFTFPTTLQSVGEANLGGNILFEDNTNITSVPFEFSPTLGLLLVGGLFGGSKVYRRNQSKKVIN